jgi:hypothetical protein
MDEQEIAAAIGLTFSSVFSRHGYRATTAGLLLALLGLLVAGHIWAAVAVLALTLARYGYYLYRRYMISRLRPASQGHRRQ